MNLLGNAQQIISSFPAKFRSIIKDKFFVHVTWGIAIVTLLNLLSYLLAFQRLPDLVPLWYSRPWGTEQLAHPLWLLLLPIVSAVFHGLNTIVAVTIISEYPIFVRTLFIVSAAVSILSLIAVVQILLLVT